MSNSTRPLKKTPRPRPASGSSKENSLPPSEPTIPLPLDLKSARALVDAEDRVLSVADVVRLVPYSRTKVNQMIAERRIEMIYVSGRRIITRKKFREAADSGFPLPIRARRQQERRLSDLRRAARAALKDPSASNLERLEEAAA